MKTSLPFLLLLSILLCVIARQPKGRPHPPEIQKESTALTVEENGEIFKQEMTLINKDVGNVLHVDVPAHGQFQKMSVVIAADRGGNWHTKDNMMFKTDKYSKIIDLPAGFNPMEVFKDAQNFAKTDSTLHKREENIFYSILVDQGSLSSNEIKNLHPDIRELVESTTVSRVKPVDITEDQFISLQKGVRIAIKNERPFQPEDDLACSNYTAQIFRSSGAAGCWQWTNPVTGEKIGVHQIVVTTDGTPDPESISCCDSNPSMPNIDFTDCCDSSFPSLCTCASDILNTNINEDFTEECKSRDCSQTQSCMMAGLPIGRCIQSKSPIPAGLEVADDGDCEGEYCKCVIFSQQCVQKQECLFNGGVGCFPGRISLSFLPPFLVVDGEGLCEDTCQCLTFTNGGKGTGTGIGTGTAIGTGIGLGIGNGNVAIQNV